MLEQTLAYLSSGKVETLAFQHLLVFQLRLLWKYRTNTDPSLTLLLVQQCFEIDREVNLYFLEPFLQLTQNLATVELLRSRTTH